MVEESFTVMDNIKLCEGVYKMTLMPSSGYAQSIKCGQFMAVEVPCRQDSLLKRPFAIYNYDEEKRQISFCYQVVGKGTEHLSRVEKGQALRGAYPLGNGFKIDEGQKRVILVGGGVGIFPLYSVFKAYPDKVFYSVMGFKERCDVILTKEFEERSSELILCTEDGSMGEAGFVTEALRRNIERIMPDLMLCCGPRPMLKALKDVMRNYPHIPVQVSIEERMACGIGACLVCACAVRKNGKVVNKRVCRDGPVFSLYEVEL
jgi:dihydroorotate dehydrogenase electron transfer subunit